MFKVGDRVRIVTPTPNFCLREESFLGRFGTVTGVIGKDGYDIRIDGADTDWSFDKSEVCAASDLGGQFIPDTGPTLLDQFAMHALTGMMALSVKTDGDFHTDVVVRRCWDVANEMMKAREAQK